MLNFANNYIIEHAEYIIAVIYVCMSVGVTAHAILYKRDTRAVIAWVGLAWLSPHCWPSASWPRRLPPASSPRS